MARAFFFTGPPGAGKSSVAFAWATLQKPTTACLSVDDIRHFLKSGFVDARDGYTHEANAQYELARAQCARLAAGYLAQGIDCVIDDIVLPSGWPTATEDEWQSRLEGYDHTLVVLLPSLEVVLRRNKARGSKALPAQIVELTYGVMDTWRGVPGARIIETTDLTLAEVVTRVSELIDGGP